MTFSVSETRVNEGTKIKYLFDRNQEQIRTASLNGISVFHFSIPNVQRLSNGDIEDGSDIQSNKLLIQKRQILLSKLNPRKSTVCIAEPHPQIMTVCSTEFICLIPKSNEIDLGFFFYSFSTNESTELFDSLTESVTYSHQRMSPDCFENLYVRYPPLKEQQLISRYLDEKTAQIDSLIEKIEKKIELLREQRTSLINQCVTKGLDPNAEMKDCGVEWIGGIPKHWRLKKITHVTKTIGSGTTPKSDSPEYYDDGTVNWLVTGDLTDGEVHTTSSKITQKAISDYPSLRTYPIDSLLVAMYGATIGKLGILRVASTVNQATCSLCFNASNDTMFWFYVLYANRQYLVSLGYGGGQPNISQDLIKSLRFPAPDSLDEQRDIVQEIGRRLKNHDALVSTEVRRLELLKEYRQSLISSVVTGKIRITEDMV